MGGVCSKSGNKEWVLGYHAGRGGGGCLGSVCKGDRATCHQERSGESLLSWDTLVDEDWGVQTSVTFPPTYSVCRR